MGPNTRARLTKIPKNEKARVHFALSMGVVMTGFGTRIKRRVGGGLLWPTWATTSELLSRVSFTAMEPSLISTELSTRVSGRIVYSLEKALRSGRTVLLLKVSFKKVKSLAEESSSGLTAAFTLVCCKTTSYMGKVCTNGQMEESIGGCGRKITWMERVCSFGRTVGGSAVSTRKTRRKAMASTSTLTAISTSATGKMGFSTAQVSSLQRMAVNTRASGVKESSLTL